ncbi:MAG: cyclic nucleotide-binding domain-containing protein [Elusimicrobia bacterium]|nr:cyclic nucleotide-binding domain-containing protein [Elusimicrobiota bacterium]
MSEAWSDARYFLKKIFLFATLPDEAVQRIADCLKPLSFPKGAVICREGDPGNSLFLIQSGRVRVVDQHEQEEQTLAYLGRGDALGEMGLLTGDPCRATVKTDTPCEVLVLTKETFETLLKGYPAIAVHLSHVLSQRLAMTPQGRLRDTTSSELIALVNALTLDEQILVTTALAIALVEQTRRRILLLDLGTPDGAAARALGLRPILSSEAMFREEDLHDARVLQRILNIHPSGLEVISLPYRVLAGHLFPALHPFLNLLKQLYDFTLLLLPDVLQHPVTTTIMEEADTLLFVAGESTRGQAATLWEQSSQLVAMTKKRLHTVWLRENLDPPPFPADVMIPWSEGLVERFRLSGSPYLHYADQRHTTLMFDRLARRLGKLRVGLALGSGAAYGYTIIGVLRVFEREGIPVDTIAGTSMGALIGSFHAAGKNADELEAIARSITKRWLYERMFWDLTLPRAGILAGQTVAAFLRDVLGDIEFPELQTPFAAVATDILTGNEVVVNTGKVYQAVRASISLPIVFTPYEHQGKYLVDGGLVNPVPTSVVRGMGADLLISVNLTSKPELRRALPGFRRVLLAGPYGPNMIEVFFKMLYTMQYEIAQARTELAHVTITPETRNFLWTEFHRAAELIRIGEEAAEPIIPKIKALLPFFADYCRVPLRQPDFVTPY